MSIVAPAERSPATRRKATTRRTEDDLPLHSFRSLLRDLATLVLNKATVPSNPNYTFYLLTKPTPLQARAFQLLAVSLVPQYGPAPKLLCRGNSMTYALPR